MRAALLACAILVAQAPAFAADLAVSGPGGEKTFTPDELAKLPQVSLDSSFIGEHGLSQAQYGGPLLWDVVGAVIDRSHPRDAVRQIVTIAGIDGYVVVLALGEIAPVFEAKQVVLATSMNGAPLAADHLRLVVPGDKRGGRSVHDIVRIAVTQAAAP